MNTLDMLDQKYEGLATLDSLDRKYATPPNVLEVMYEALLAGHSIEEVRGYVADCYSDKNERPTVRP